jgi:NO-binding membrane sensor protein with MHYT domain
MGLYVEYRAAFLSLTVAVSLIGTYGAVAACEQFRISICSGNRDAHYKQLLLVAVCLGGVCIWGEFYMMTAAYRLHNSTGAVVLLQYDTALCVSSVPVVVILTYVGLIIASTDAYFTRSKKDIMETYRSSLPNAEAGLTLDTNSFIGNLIVSTHNPWRIIVGSLFMSVALVVMRVMGFASIKFPGAVVESNGPIVAQAVIAVVGSATGFFIYFRLLSLYPSWEILRLAAAVHGVFLFTGARLVSLAGVTFEYDPTVGMPSKEVSLTSAHLVVGVIISAVMTSFLILGYVLADLRTWLQRTRAQQRQADRALLALLYRSSAEREQIPVVTPQGSTRQARVTLSQRRAQAPPEVVNYTRQYLKSVPRRAASPTAIFTAQHRLFYDVDPDHVDPDQLDHPEGSLDGSLAHRSPQEAFERRGHTSTPVGSGQQPGTLPVPQSLREVWDDASETAAVGDVGEVL